MKEKVRKFVEEHKTDIGIAVGTGVVVLSSGIVGYKIGYGRGMAFAVKHICDRFGGGIGKLLGTALESDALYGNVLGADEDPVKFKDLAKLAKDAVNLDPSHLEDTVAGMFVFTKKG